METQESVMATCLVTQLHFHLFRNGLKTKTKAGLKRAVILNVKCTVHVGIMQFDYNVIELLIVF